jgi:hypothetical protein
MTDITLTFPVELTAAQIILLNAEPGDKSSAVTEADEGRARELAEELHCFLATVQTLEATATLRLADIPFTGVDLVDAMRRQALGLVPKDPHAEFQESEWVFEMLDALGGNLAIVFCGCGCGLIRGSSRPATWMSTRNCTDSKNRRGRFMSEPKAPLERPAFGMNRSGIPESARF